MSSFTLADALATWEAIDAEVCAELARAHELHGGQHLPSGMGPHERSFERLDFNAPSNRRQARSAQNENEVDIECNTLTWSGIHLEEVTEFLAESPDIDPDAWRAEGVQVICTVIRAMTDQRTSEGD